MKTSDRALPFGRLRPTALFAAILAAAFGGSAQAARINYQVELTGLHSDNLNLSEGNEVSETVLIPRLRFDVKEEGAAVELQARGHFERRHYVNDRFDDESRGEFAGQLNWSLLPQRLNLVVEDYLSEEPISIRAGSYPGNLQRVNVFIGGPTFFAHVSDATHVQVDLRVTNTNAEITNDFDGKRYSAAGKLLRELDESKQVSLNAIHTKVELDDQAAAPDYTRNDVFATYHQALPKGDMTLEGGYSRIDHEPGLRDASSPILRAEVRWEFGRNQLTLHARKQFADAVQDLVIRNLDLYDPVVPDLAESSVLVNPQVYRQRFFDIAYRYRSERWSVRLRPFYTQYRYLDNNFNDRRDLGVFFGVDYRPRPRLTLSLQGVARNREFFERDRHDRDRFYSLNCDYQLTRHWSWQAAVYRNTRDSDLADPVYKENAARFTIAWHR